MCFLSNTGLLRCVDTGVSTLKSLRRGANCCQAQGYLAQSLDFRILSVKILFKFWKFIQIPFLFTKTLAWIAEFL